MKKYFYCIFNVDQSWVEYIATSKKEVKKFFKQLTDDTENTGTYEKKPRKFREYIELWCDGIEMYLVEKIMLNKLNSNLTIGACHNI